MKPLVHSERLLSFYYILIEMQKGSYTMNKNSIKNIEFITFDIIAALNQLSNDYSVSFDALVNYAVLKFIEDVNLLRQLRSGELDPATLSEIILSL